LGGTIGVGTLLYATAIGPITHLTIPALAIGRRRGAGAPAAQGVRDVREAPGGSDAPTPTREPARVTQNL
ncbi:MAG TPA: hypothetical protein VHW96_01585, partial [Solirubrobacteraceae bacterium]|nr:hypothetical protein [Solirubrobacteraceae bacterium]